MMVPLTSKIELEVEGLGNFPSGGIVHTCPGRGVFHEVSTLCGDCDSKETGVASARAALETQGKFSVPDTGLQMQPLATRNMDLVQELPIL